MRYDAPVITGVAAPLLDTRGGETITIRGTNFGPAGSRPVRLVYAHPNAWTAYQSTNKTIVDIVASRVYSSDACSVVNDTTITCSSVPGVGRGLAPRVSVGAQDSLVFTGQTLSYKAPTVIRVAGTNIERLETQGGANFQLIGDQFGPAPSSPSIDTVADDVLVLSLTSGEPSLARTPHVSYGHASTSKLSPIQPLPVPPAEGDLCPTPGMQWCEQQCGSRSWSCGVDTSVWSLVENVPGYVCIDQSPSGFNGFRNITASNPVCELAPTLNYTALSCVVVVPHTTIECYTTEGIGAHLSAKVTSLAGQASQLSWPSTLSYGPPVLSFYEGPGAHDADTAGGQMVALHGVNFGPVWTPLLVTYGASGTDYVASGCVMTLAHTLITCNTVKGAGSRLTFQVAVDNQIAVTHDGLRCTHHR